MADWVHCNNCYLQPGPDRSFLLTNCGHIYCGVCVSSNAKEKCSICGTKCSTIPLTSQMRPDIEMYFTDPRELLRKYMKNFHQVVEFQHGHRMRLFSYYKNLLNLREEYKRLQRKYIEIERHCHKLEEENEQNRYKHQNGRVPSSQVSNSSRIPNSNQTSNKISPSTPSYALNRVSLRTPPVNGKLGPINTYPLPNSNNSGSRGRPNNKPATAMANISHFLSPMNVSPPSSLKSVQLNSGKSSCSIPNTSFCTPPQCAPHPYSGPGNSGWNNPAHDKNISPTNFPIRLPASRPSSFGLIRRATISPYSQE